MLAYSVMQWLIRDRVKKIFKMPLEMKENYTPTKHSNQHSSVGYTKGKGELERTLILSHRDSEVR